jgi:FkbM family methyltransferase
MLRHSMEKNMGAIRPLNIDEFFTHYRGFKIVAPFDQSWVIGEVNEVYLKPKRNEVVIDVGAHYGFYTLLASRLVGKEGYVFAFEPSSRNFRRLSLNLQLNSIQNAKTFNFALGNFEGSARLYHSHYSGGHSIFFKRGTDSEIVAVKRLDNVVKQAGLERISLIKIDVEGAEKDVLEGALQTIKKCRPRITIAGYHYEKEAKEIEGWFTKKAPFFKVKIIGDGFVHAIPKTRQ